MSSKKYDFNQKSKVRCNKYRKKILEISQKVSALHIAPAFSCTEIVDVIYNCIFQKKNKDIFLMSKGHIFSMLFEEKDYKTKDQITIANQMVFLVRTLILKTQVLRVQLVLGHGLGISVGMAYAEKLKKTKTKIFSVLR